MKGTSLCYTVMLELQLDGLPADSICQVALFCKALVFFLTNHEVSDGSSFGMCE